MWLVLIPVTAVRTLMQLWHPRNSMLCPRQARAVHGAYEGTWYYEVRMEHMGATGHARLGWGTRKAELQAPVRFPREASCVAGTFGMTSSLD